MWVAILIFWFPAEGQEEKLFHDAMKQPEQHNQGNINDYVLLIG